MLPYISNQISIFATPIYYRIYNNLFLILINFINIRCLSTTRTLKPCFLKIEYRGILPDIRKSSKLFIVFYFYQDTLMLCLYFIELSLQQRLSYIVKCLHFGSSSVDFTYSKTFDFSMFLGIYKQISPRITERTN